MKSMILPGMHRVARLGLVGAMVGMAACDSSGPFGLGDLEPGNALGVPRFSDLQDTLTAAGPLRVEIRLVADALIAREVEIEDDGESEEEIEGRVVAIESSGDGGAFVLEPGDVRVQFDASTRFRFDDDGDDVTVEVFTARIQQLLDAGDGPVIDAERPAPVEPQAPDDTAFLAVRIDLEDDDDDDDDDRGTKLELFIDADNLRANDTPPPHGWVRVLGMDIEIRLDGTTDLDLGGDDDDDGDIEFEAAVASVDLDGSTVTLTTGRVVRIVAATRFDDDDEGLRSLMQVAEAIGFGLRVEAEGEGHADPDDAGVVIASEIEFEVEDDRERDVEELVQSVDVDARTVTLMSGTVIRIASFTEWDDDDTGLMTLDDVAAAVAAGGTVEADVDAVPLEDGTMVAIEIEFEPTNG